MKNETTLKKEKEQFNQMKDHKYFDGNINLENKESILVRNVDIKMDIFNTNLEKDIKRLPANLRFIKKYLYLHFFPKIDRLIDELEKIKKTSNYDEKAIQIKPAQITKSVQISCCDFFDNHNIKHMRSNKIIYGSLSGNIVIFDFEISKVLNEKFLGIKSRVEILATSTIKVYDSLISRIAINFRGDPNITILSYNHTYNTFTNECIINLKDQYANFTIDQNSISLNTLPCNIKLSKDTYFMTVFDYLGGIRVFKFNEIPQSPSIMDSRPQKKDSVIGFNFMMGKSNNLATNLSTNSFSNNLSTLNNNLSPANAGNINNNVQITANLLGYYKFKDIENFTILAINSNKNINQNTDINDKNKAGKGAPVVPAKKEDPNKNKKPPEKGPNTNQAGEEETGCYNLKAVFDDSNSDLTPLIKYSKNNPEIVYVQKKLILEEKNQGGFSTCIVTVGIYIGFNGTTQFKYVSLYPYLTDNMKNVFKVTKSKGAGVISQEESMSLASTMAKKEKDYINYIKSKLDPMINNMNTNNNFNSGNNINNNQYGVTGQIMPNNTLGTKDFKTPATNIVGSGNSNSNNIHNPNFAENTRSEFNFNTLVNISCLCGQNQISQKASLIAIGMIDGSVLIWDTELHCDKFLFQENKNEILSMSLNSNFLTTSAKDGQVYIYDLVKGCRVFNCFHNPYKNFPVYYVRILNIFNYLIIFNFILNNLKGII